MPVKHLSFDVWNTLIKPNPEFGAARKRFLVAELSLPLEVVEAVYRQVKDGADKAAEETGAGKTSAEVYEAFMNALCRPDADWWRLRRGVELLFGKHPPIVLPETIENLRLLQLRGFTLSIGSNTNFISGACLSDVVLDTWGVAWDYKVFSDEISHSKPHPYFWQVVTERAWAHADAKPDEILHIGDHMICDGGCREHGIRFTHVKGADDLPPVLEGIR